MTASSFNWELTVWVWLMLTITGVIVGLMFGVCTKSWNVFWAVLGTFVAVGLVVAIPCGGSNRVPTNYETQYKVTISDEVSMNEFNEKYEIINQEGKIYMVREKK